MRADPAYGPAWAGLATARHWYAGTRDDRSEAQELDRRALEAAERAVAVRPRLGDGYAVRGFLRAEVLWDWEGAEADLRRALELSPGDAMVLRHHGRHVLAAQGRLEEGIAELKRSTELDPLYASAWVSLGGVSKIVDLRLARAALERALQIAPENPLANFHLVTVLLLEGRADEARAAAERIRDDDFWHLVAVALTEHSLGHAAGGRRALEELTRLHGETGAYQIAFVHAWRGEPERAFEWLERAYAQHDLGLGELLTEPLLRPLRGDPRFDALLRKVGLPVSPAPGPAGPRGGGSLR